MDVMLDDIGPYNIWTTIGVNSSKPTPFHLFLDAAVKIVAYLRISTRSQYLANQ